MKSKNILIKIVKDSKINLPLLKTRKKRNRDGNFAVRFSIFSSLFKKKRGNWVEKTENKTENLELMSI